MSIYDVLNDGLGKPFEYDIFSGSIQIVDFIGCYVDSSLHAIPIL